VLWGWHSTEISYVETNVGFPFGGSVQRCLGVAQSFAACHINTNFGVGWILLLRFAYLASEGGLAGKNNS